MSNWKAVLGLEEMYEVSDSGEVRSLPRLDSRGYKWRGKLISTHSQKPYGHHSVILYHAGRGHKRWVHRLVLEAFKGIAPAGLQSCHRDGDSANNHARNLYWGTAIQNAADKRRHGTHLQGSQIVGSKFTEADIRRVMELREEGCSYTQIRTMIGASIAHISNIINGKVWKHLELN